MPASTGTPASAEIPASSPPLASLAFEDALAELERIAQAMEAGNLPLEESLTAYKRGVELLQHCQQQLSDAEQKVQILENGTLKELGGDPSGA
ncbi:hypothetical protein AZSI13_03110 [Azospira sp. I13]|uniref:exodeoxyribonuclease VII small subunit n=1 Tax=Azospira sp. I13 TaxID=1765050 RepID=UPI000D41B2E7|nr:exodeoxyribonuclease VII small subunit [Azospira sp. I13]GBG00984.1 hypothetical protein AZSI13_03110 [Azospira sp. I13]